MNREALLVELRHEISKTNIDQLRAEEIMNRKIAQLEETKVWKRLLSKRRRLQNELFRTLKGA